MCCVLSIIRKFSDALTCTSHLISDGFHLILLDMTKIFNKILMIIISCLNTLCMLCVSGEEDS